MKLILIALAALLILAAIPLTLTLVKQRQEIRKEAVGENQLICMPIDDQGNLTNEKYDYNRIKVINNTSEEVILWVQENLCDYQADLSPSYRCNQYHNRYSDTIDPQERKIYTLDVPCNKTGQLDVAQDDEQMGTYTPDCYNTVDKKIWQGGIAFTIYSRACDLTPSPTPTPTGIITPTPTPTPTPTGIITPTPEYRLNCQQLKAYDQDWQEKDLSDLSVGKTVYFLVQGSCDEPQGITDARFRINNGEWLKPTDRKGNHFYLKYEITSAGSYKVEAIVYNPALGWR